MGKPLTHKEKMDKRRVEVRKAVKAGKIAGGNMPHPRRTTTGKKQPA
jgi:hypothetical protein